MNIEHAALHALLGFEEADTSSGLHPLQRPKFGELMTHARPGDTEPISKMFRLVRGTGHILDVLDVLHRDASPRASMTARLSAMDLPSAARASESCCPS
ncbi:hypothetical protein [Streptomyces sp. TLI_105]|uniref:hypothetical protein n=1 Tax=Streptomyces sp. TLI_105 TaxID=1881019 RepID=UPI00089C19A3|nr:hypothetical protein [Streptomyces sp. TLI_105]SEE22540.1 hypothetical protein SAMN05428939_7787 [Streptomyces sp. TLI_105]